MNIYLHIKFELFPLGYEQGFVNKIYKTTQIQYTLTRTSAQMLQNMIYPNNVGTYNMMPKTL